MRLFRYRSALDLDNRFGCGEGFCLFRIIIERLRDQRPADQQRAGHGPGRDTGGEHAEAEVAQAMTARVSARFIADKGGEQISQ